MNNREIEYGFISKRVSLGKLKNVISLWLRYGFRRVEQIEMKEEGRRSRQKGRGKRKGK